MKLRSVRGLTLIELMITIIMFIAIIGVAVSLFRAVAISWSGMEKREGINVTLNRALKEISSELREAVEIGAAHDDEIRFSSDSANYYIYYLYNSDDSYPPDFKEELYKLMRTSLSGGISGGFRYGSGRVILTDVIPPDTSDLSVGTAVTLDLSVLNGDETVRMKTYIKPRNL